MILQILSLVGGIIALAAQIFNYLHEKKMIDAEMAADHLSTLKAQVDAAHDALNTRELQRRLDDLNGVPKHDEFDRDG